MDEPRSPPSEEAELQDLRDRVERLSAALDAARAQAAQLEALAHEDALTGILNRRGFLRDLTRALAYGSRYNAPAGLLICDLDAFKLINDRYGHPVGDRALRHAADLLRAHIRTSDSVGRLGGDEFALVIWQVDAAQAEHKARAIEALIAAEPLALDRAVAAARRVGRFHASARRRRSRRCPRPGRPGHVRPQGGARRPLDHDAFD